MRTLFFLISIILGFIYLSDSGILGENIQNSPVVKTSINTIKELTVAVKNLTDSLNGISNSVNSGSAGNAVIPIDLNKIMDKGRE